MESENQEQHIDLACKNDIDRRKKEKQYSIGKKQKSEHFARIVIFSAVEQTIDTTHTDISYEGTQESYEEENQRKHRIDRSACLCSKRCSEHTSHKGKNDKQ